MQETYLLISEVAGLLKVESHVLRYWEEELELNVKRNELGHRCYTQKDIQFLLQVKEWKEKGYPLKAIKSFLCNPSDNLIPMPVMTAQSAAPSSVLPTATATAPVGATALTPSPAPRPAAQRQPLSPDQKMEQFQAILNRIVSNAIRENNVALGQEVGAHVSERVLKEMDYLMRTQEEALEAHFQNLDQAIRKQQLAKPEKAKMLPKGKKEKKPKVSRKEAASIKRAATLRGVKAMQEAAASKE